MTTSDKVTIHDIKQQNVALSDSTWHQVTTSDSRWQHVTSTEPCQQKPWRRSPFCRGERDQHTAPSAALHRMSRSRSLECETDHVDIPVLPTATYTNTYARIQATNSWPFSRLRRVSKWSLKISKKITLCCSSNILLTRKMPYWLSKQRLTLSPPFPLRLYTLPFHFVFCVWFYNKQINK